MTREAEDLAAFCDVAEQGGGAFQVLVVQMHQRIVEDQGRLLLPLVQTIRERHPEAERRNAALPGGQVPCVADRSALLIGVINGINGWSRRSSWSKNPSVVSYVARSIGC